MTTTTRREEELRLQLGVEQREGGWGTNLSQERLIEVAKEEAN